MVVVKCPLAQGPSEMEPSPSGGAAHHCGGGGNTANSKWLSKPFSKTYLLLRLTWPKQVTWPHVVDERGVPPYRGPRRRRPEC